MAQEKVGVLLVNLGTPDGTDYVSMRRYLSQFLSDPRVIEWPKIYWCPILQFIVLSIRPQKSGANYARIWNKEQDESPLRTYTRSQAEKLQQRFDSAKVSVRYAMRYGQPSVKSVTNEMIKDGCDRILMVPLYPQYSATTTATVCDAFFKALRKERVVPAVRTLPAYPDAPVYIKALADSINAHLKTLDFKPERIIASFHGIPQSYADKGDTYPEHCKRTVEALRQYMKLDDETLMMTYQSRFGPEEWLKPYTDETVEELAKNGIKSIAVFNPGFVSDCLETVDEIGREVCEEFLAHGGENFTHIPCLNDSEDGMKVIEDLVKQELAGWI